MASNQWPKAEELTVEWLSSTLGLQVGSFSIEKKSQNEFVLALDLAGDDASRDQLTLRATYGSNEHAVSFYKRGIATVGVRVPRCYYAQINQMTGESLLLIEQEQGTSALSAPYEDRIDDAVVALAKMHAQYWNDDALREQLLDLHKETVSREAKGHWAEKLKQYAPLLDGCPAREMAVISAVVDRYDTEGVYLHNRWRMEGAFGLVNGNFTPLQLMFPAVHSGPSSKRLASPSFTRRMDEGKPLGKQGEVLALDWQSCGVGMPVQDLFMALVPWMTYLPREFRADLEQKMLELYYKTLVACGVKGFPISQLLQEYALSAVNFVPFLFDLIDLSNSEPIGQILHCVPDFDMLSHLIVSYSDALDRHGALEYVQHLYLEGPSLIRTFQMQDLTHCTHLLAMEYANVNEVDLLGISPLGYSSYLGNMPLVELAIAHNADLNLANKAGATPLTLAARHKRTQVALRLLAAGAKVNAVNTEQGYSALVFAACNGDLELIHALIEHGADIGGKCLQGKTALEHAQQQRQPRAAELLSNSLLCTHLTAASPKAFVPSPQSGLMSPVNRDRKQSALHVNMPYTRAGFE